MQAYGPHPPSSVRHHLPAARLYDVLSVSPRAADLMVGAMGKGRKQ